MTTDTEAQQITHVAISYAGHLNKAALTGCVSCGKARIEMMFAINA